MSNDTLKDAQKSFQAISKLFGEIVRLEKKKFDNLADIKAKLFQAETIIAGMIETDALKTVLEQLHSFAKDLTDVRPIDTSQYGIGLAQYLKELGINLSGQYPELKAGLFQLDVNFEQGSTIIWYGPKQEKVAQCSLDPKEVAEIIQETQSRLGSQLTPEAFADKLKEAYRLSMSDGRPASIIQVLSIFTLVYQDQKYFHDPKLAHFREYTRIDFSYDLLRLREYLVDELRLTVAT
ncbi:MAG: hypothetical protein SF029_06405, partial [bacterium]|nr:hypothetical protein [bacterium]